MIEAPAAAACFPALVCPDDRAALEERGELLVCARGHRFPRRAGIPRIVATEMLTKAFFPLHRRAKRRVVLQRMVSQVSPLLTYYHEYPQLGDRLQYEWALLDTHDSLTDYYKHFRTERQIRDALSALGGTEIWVAAGGNGVEARCRKPGVGVSGPEPEARPPDPGPRSPAPGSRTPSPGF